MIPFVKTHALGNDFILVEHTAKIPADFPELAKRICHRHFGVGADGLILWKKLKCRSGSVALEQPTPQAPDHAAQQSRLS